MANRHGGFVNALLAGAGASVTGSGFQHGGGQLSIQSTVGAGSFEVQLQGPDDVWRAIAGLTGITSTAVQTPVEVPKGLIRAVTNGSGSGITVYAINIPS